MTGEKAKETKERTERESRNQEYAGGMYQVLEPANIPEPDEDLLPWGGLNIRHVVSRGHESESRRSSAGASYDDYPPTSTYSPAHQYPSAYSPSHPTHYMLSNSAPDASSFLPPSLPLDPAVGSPRLSCGSAPPAESSVAWGASAIAAVTTAASASGLMGELGGHFSPPIHQHRFQP